MKILIAPETLNSTACAIENGPLGLLFVQCLDAYGFQREMTVRESNDTKGEFLVSVYVHPGRRHTVRVSRKEWESFRASFCDTVARYPDCLFNKGNASRAQCAGFVSMQEMIFRNVPLKDVL